MKKWDRNHVKLQDFIIFRWLKDKLDLQLRPIYIIGKFALINCKTFQVVIICSYKFDLLRRNTEIGINLDTN